MYRFFCGPEAVCDGVITLSDADTKHIAVLRLGVNERVIVCDGKGTDYICAVSRNAAHRLLCEIIEQRACPAEPGIRAVLFQGMPKNDKMELIVQKCVELGVYEIFPVITKNTVVKTNERTAQKTERYNKISEAAAKQSGRGVIPRVHEPVGFTEAVKRLAGLDEAYMAYENEAAGTLRQVFEQQRGGETAGFMIGPEGGFTEDEAGHCARAGVKTVSLGKRILRTETAGLAILSAYLYARGEM